MWVRKSSKLKKAWSNQNSLNIWSSRFTNWQIGTNFVDLPTNGDNAVIARSPMRPEIIEMANERHKRKKFALPDSDDEDIKRSSTDVLLIGDNKQHKAPQGVVNSFMTEQQKYFISELLLGADISSSLSEIKSSVSNQEFNTIQSAQQPPTLERRKLVICYFRDKNGDVMTNALLRSGFDVLLFERGYHKGLSDTEKKKFGQEWIVHREHEKHSVINSSDEETLDSYWKKIVHKYNRKLLEDDDTGLSEVRQDSGVLTNTTSLTGIISTKQDKRESNKDHINQSQNPQHNHDGSDDKDERLAMERLSYLASTDSLDPPRIIRVTDMSLFVPLLSIADGVASSAGSQLLSECIYANVPILALYRENDDEQMVSMYAKRKK